jgi:hypothetical protein
MTIPVSQFELVFKPQSPSGPADTVLQGYFLKISNLENQSLQFSARFVTSSISDPDRSLFANTIVFVDTPGSNNNPGSFSLSGGLQSKAFSLNRRITIPAHGTALLAVLPSDPFSMPGDPPATPDFECRGYVELSLPALLKAVIGPGGVTQFKFEAQSEKPVKVLLTPQHRATYFSGVDGSIADQTQSSIPVSSGKGENMVPPGKPFFLPFPGKLDLDLIAQIPDLQEEAGPMLAALLAQAEAAGLELGEFNKQLRSAGINMAVERRTPRVAAAAGTADANA